ncbi:unnamed protein product [Urochloa humidicola]
MATRLLLVAAATVVTTLCAMAVAHPDAKTVLPFAPTCSTTANYTDGSEYKKNLDQLLATLPATTAGSTRAAPARALTRRGVRPHHVLRRPQRHAVHGVPRRRGRRDNGGVPGQPARNVSAAYDACACSGTRLRRSPPLRFPATRSPCTSPASP